VSFKNPPVFEKLLYKSMCCGNGKRFLPAAPKPKACVHKTRAFSIPKTFLDVFALEGSFVSAMSKAFTKENDADDDGDEGLPALPSGVKNYITPAGYARLRAEWLTLMDEERPRIVEAVHWAAKNGDRSENGDYLYGKKRLREIDRRIRFLTKRLEMAEVTDPSVHQGNDQVFFGATVTYVNEAGVETTVTIMGIDEADSSQQQVSWISPVARALLKSRVGDVVKLVTPQGTQEIEVLQVLYPDPAA
jgi:transcription elongation factor GreB